MRGRGPAFEHSPDTGIVAAHLAFSAPPPELGHQGAVHCARAPRRWRACMSGRGLPLCVGQQLAARRLHPADKSQAALSTAEGGGGLWEQQLASDMIRCDPHKMWRAMAAPWGWVTGSTTNSALRRVPGVPGASRPYTRSAVAACSHCMRGRRLQRARGIGWLALWVFTWLGCTHLERSCVCMVWIPGWACNRSKQCKMHHMYAFCCAPPRVQRWHPAK